MRALSLGLIALSSLALTACAMAPIPPPEPTLANIQAVRAGGFAALQVGAFTPGPGAPTTMDRTVTVRAGTQKAPSGSYATFLGETLAAELKGAGKLDAASGLVVSGVLTKTHVDSGLPDGSAALEARFTLKKNGAVTYDKTLGAEAAWKSSLMGAIAIPDAFNHYNALFPEIVTKLLSDPDFRAAAKAGG